MKVKVLKAFKNTKTQELYKLGTVADINDDKFVEKLVTGKYVEVIVDYTLEKDELLQKIEKADKQISELKDSNATLEKANAELEVSNENLTKEIAELKSVIEKMANESVENTADNEPVEVKENKKPNTKK